MHYVSKIFFLSTCLLLSSCDHFTYTPKDTQPRHQPEQIASELKKWNNQQKISLRRHQLIPIDYLEKNSNIKGLIINHYLGTGKTYLAIGFAERNPKRPVIILSQRFLKAHWLEHLKLYGVKDPTRYRFLNHEEAPVLLKEDLSQSIVIIDESHRLIEKVRSTSQNADLYFHLRKAHRILSLTGTPIYNDVFDLIYQINLVSGKNLLSFNQQTFLFNYSKIKPFNAYWRGHVLESLYFPMMVTHLTNTLIPVYFKLGLMESVVYPICLQFSPEILKIFTPVNLENNLLRDFDLIKLKSVIAHYISYYNLEKNTEDYPASWKTEKDLSYNQAQLEFLIKFYDSALNDIELSQLLKDKTSIGLNSEFSNQKNITINSSSIQDTQKTMPGAGREIGNLSFTQWIDNSSTLQKKGKVQKTIFPEKFNTILKTINQSQGSAVIYSHYYYNGILLFKQFLDHLGYQGKYKIFHPNLSFEEHAQIIREFNNGKIKILLLHPEVTEGLSLKGTRQLHFLEVPINGSIQQQIIGRTIRYQSHLHLPKNERNVKIYVWKYIFSPHDLTIYTALRKNWHRNFTELNYYSNFGVGRQQIDKNTLLKNTSPDTKSFNYLQQLNRLVDNFKKYTQIFSIENSKYN